MLRLKDNTGLEHLYINNRITHYFVNKVAEQHSRIVDRSAIKSVGLRDIERSKVAQVNNHQLYSTTHTTIHFTEKAIKLFPYKFLSEVTHSSRYCSSNTSHSINFTEQNSHLPFIQIISNDLNSDTSRMDHNKKVNSELSSNNIGNVTTHIATIKVIDSQRKYGKMTRLTKNELPTIRTESWSLKDNLTNPASYKRATSRITKRIEENLELGYYAKICI